jgi:hypothetical protein
MLIHFASDPRQRCDNCGTRGTLMHLVFAPSDGSLDLCRTCFGALVLALNRAARKLGMSGKTQGEIRPAPEPRSSAKRGKLCPP